MSGPRSRAAAKQVRAMRAAGSLDDEQHAALIDLVKGLAAAIDADPGAPASLWKEYRAAVASLTEMGADGRDSTADAVIELLRPSLGDAADA